VAPIVIWKEASNKNLFLMKAGMMKNLSHALILMKELPVANLFGLLTRLKILIKEEYLMKNLDQCPKMTVNTSME
jgi:hypothetical protein